MEMQERIFMIFFILVVVIIKAPCIKILAGLPVIGCVRTDFFLITFVVVQNVALRTNSLLLIGILLTRNTFWSATNIVLSGIWIHQ